MKRGSIPAVALIVGLSAWSSARVGEVVSASRGVADSLPPTRGFAQLVAHPPSGRLLLFGGEGKGRVSLNDMWSYDPAADRWNQVEVVDAPTDQGGAATAYDAKADRIIAYYHTRLSRTAHRGLVRLSETWAYDVRGKRWTNLQPDSAPFGLMGSKMVYDAAADRLILFGGADYTQEATPYFTDTWEYDFNTNRWSLRHPSRHPPGRGYFGMVYDAAADRTLVFAGRGEADEAHAGELWAYNYTADSWDLIPYRGDVVADHHPAMAYAPGIDKTYYIANMNAWSFDFPSRTWTPLAYDSAMGVRYFATLAFEPRSKTLVLFGGGPRGLRYDNQTWVYDPAADRWRRGGGAP